MERPTTLLANHVITVDTRLGEVIAASTSEFIAEASRLHGAPAFGKLVKVVEGSRPTIYGLVSYAETGGLDPSRRAVARSVPPTLIDDQIYDAYPELRDVLRTEFTAHVVGFVEMTGAIRHWLPPFPASLHFSVVQCDDAETLRFTESFDYLTTALAHPSQSIELVAATMREGARVRGNDEGYLLRAGRAIAALLADDYKQLLQVLQRVAPNGEAA